MTVITTEPSAYKVAHAVAEKLRETPKLDLDKLPVLHAIFERLAASCAGAMGEYCNSPVSAFMNQLEARGSWDLLEAVEDSVALIFYVPEWDARVLIGVERRFLFSFMEAMFGGDAAEELSLSKRPFTLLEARVARAVCEGAARAFEAAFSPVAAITLTLEKVETAIDFTTLGQASVTTVSAQLLVQVLETGGRMFVFIPQAALYPLRQRLERERAANPAAADPWWSKKMQSGVAQTELSLCATMQAGPLSLADVAGFQVGQVLALNGTDKSITIECGGQRLFNAHLGHADGYFTVTTVSAINEQDELIDGILIGNLLG